jgi:hypothetical protein
MPSLQLDAKLRAIGKSGRSIYDRLDDRPDLFLNINELEEALSNELIGLSLAGYPIRTRSKVFKTAVCKALGFRIFL